MNKTMTLEETCKEMTMDCAQGMARTWGMTSDFMMELIMKYDNLEERKVGIVTACFIFYCDKVRRISPELFAKLRNEPKLIGRLFDEFLEDTINIVMTKEIITMENINETNI